MENSVIITPNQRLAHHIQSTFDTKKLLNGNSSWNTKKALSLSNWIKSLWNNLAHDQVLLKHHQEKLLWIKILTESLDTAKDNSSIVQLADLAAKAFNLLMEWQFEVTDLENYLKDNIILSKEVLLFVQLAKKFELTLKKNNLIIESQLPKFIELLLDNDQHIKLPTKLIFVGFDHATYTPLLLRLLQTLKKHNCKIIEADFNKYDATIQKVTFTSRTEEITAMARWAKDQLKHYPNASIAFVVPNLITIRPEIERIAHEVFTPPNCLQVYNDDTNYQETSLFNFSAGKRLTEYPIIAAAFSILELVANKIELSALYALLTSPFLQGFRTEFFARIALLRKIKKSFATEKNLLQQIILEGKNCSLLTENFRKYKAAFKDIDTAVLPVNVWPNIFAAILQSFGWPGDEKLSSTEFQTIERWKKLLIEFASLELITKKMNLCNAIIQLKIMASDIIFQPKTEPKKINILGMLEASGINFDFIWLMSMDNANFPFELTPNPLLPIDLQKKFSRPYSQALFNRITKSAAKIFVSYTKQDQNTEPSTFIEHIPEIKLEDLHLSDYQSINQSILRSSNMEKFVDSNINPIMPHEKLSGSTDILKLQSQCPFKAFATYRLHAKNDLDNSIFLRGELTHKVLELIWQELKHHNNLIKLHDEALQVMVSSMIDRALEHLKSLEKYNIKKNFSKIEKKCLLRLLLDWLQYEKQRTPFEIVELEQKTTASLGNLKFTLRADRIDKEIDGTHIIIDYKTSKKSPNVNDWYGERPEEPQLPLYCITSEQQIDGIKFAALHVKEKNKLKGKTRKENESEWEQLLAQWQTSLTSLAFEFYNGVAIVDPKNKNETCRYCDLKTLCRI